MEKEKRALSWQEFVDSGFDGRDYEFPDFEGTFEATILIWATCSMSVS